MSRVFWDTNLFVYLFEDYGEQSERVVAIRRRMLERRDELYTSTLTLGEILVKPIEANNIALRDRYEAALAATAVLVPFSAPAARLYAEIRRDRAIRPPDAIQLACAAHARIDLFLTNDERLSRVSVPGIHFVHSVARAVL